MANVDLVDLIPILKSIYNIKTEYKSAIGTEYDDFSLYPTLTENFIDSRYNEGYEIGFKDAYYTYLATRDIQVALPRSMRELVPETYTSDSGSADYDTLTLIMNYVLRVRMNLKNILSLDTDLFELYPPRVLELGDSNFSAGYNDGFIAGTNYVSSVSITAPVIEYTNNVITLRTTFTNANTYYKIGSSSEWSEYVEGVTRIEVPVDSSITVYAYSSLGSKSSEVVSKVISYSSIFSPIINYDSTNHIITIESGYTNNEGVITKYRLSTWEGAIGYLDYDFQAIPLQSSLTVYAYNQISESGEVSETVSRLCELVPGSVTRPSTPILSFTPSNNVLTITSSTLDANIYYRKAGTSSWSEYTGPISLIESATYEAIAIKDGIESEVSAPYTCTISSGSSGNDNVIAPYIICNNNIIHVFGRQSNITLYIRNVNGDSNLDSANNLTSGWSLYNGVGYDISKSNTYEAKAVLNSDSSKVAYSVPVICTYISSTPSSSGSEGDTYVASPILTYNDSILSITAVTAGSVILYRKEGDSEWLNYTTPVTISSSGVYEAKCVLNGNESSVNTINCVLGSSDTLLTVMDYEDDYLTITANTSTGTIYYLRAGESTWTEYTAPIHVEESGMYYSKVIDSGIKSEIIGLYCEISGIDYDSMRFMIENISLNSTAYVYGYYTYDYGTVAVPSRYGGLSAIGDDGVRINAGAKASFGGYVNPSNRDSELIIHFYPYTASLHGYVSGDAKLNVEYKAYGNLGSVLNFEDMYPSFDISTTSGRLYLHGKCHSYNNVILPNDNWSIITDSTVSNPTIDCTDNTVTITTSTTGASIYYRVSGTSSWITYTGPFTIEQTTTYEAKATFDGNESSISITECEYVVPAPTIDCVDNTVTITTSTTGATIYYRVSGTSSWIEYSTPFTITQTTTYEAKCELNGVDSEIVSEECIYIDDTYYDEYYYQYFTIEAIDSGTLRIKPKNGSYRPYYSINGGEWTQWPEDNTSFADWLSLSVSAQDKIRFKAVTNLGLGNGLDWTGSTIKFNAYGNLLSLIYGDDFTNYNGVSATYAFRNLFGKTTSDSSFSGPKIVSAYNLVFPQSFGAQAFNGMFGNCKELTTVPRKLYATTLADSCYSFMFENCTSLTSVPNNLLPATTLATSCYSHMFEGCTSLTTAPALPATTLAQGCYMGMFEGCTSLTTAPALPATTLAQGCYSAMFTYCYSLINAPDLLATTLTTNCYRGMFSVCRSLNYVKCLATDISTENCTYQWLPSTSNTGTFVKASGVEWPSGISGIPTGWTVIEV